MKILNLCAGNNPIPNIILSNKDVCINTDITKIRKDYVIWDLNKKSKFKNNTFDLIIGNGALNYIQPQNFIKVMEELWRIAKPNSIIRLEVSTLRKRTSMVLQPFKVHPNEFRIFEIGDYYNFRTKARFKILERKGDNLLLRWSKSMSWKLQVIK